MKQVIIGAGQKASRGGLYGGQSWPDVFSLPPAFAHGLRLHDDDAIRGPFGVIRDARFRENTTLDDENRNSRPPLGGGSVPGRIRPGLRGIWILDSSPK